MEISSSAAAEVLTVVPGRRIFVGFRCTVESIGKFARLSGFAHASPYLESAYRTCKSGELAFIDQLRPTKDIDVLIHDFVILSVNKDAVILVDVDS
jgi:hypothetical protein